MASIIEGVVVRHGRMQKTCTVAFDRKIVPEKARKYIMGGDRYGKGRKIRKTTRVHVHDPKEVCETGDVVKIKKSRPHSKTKHHEFHSMVRKHPANKHLMENPAAKLVTTKSRRGADFVGDRTNTDLRGNQLERLRKFKEEQALLDDKDKNPFYNYKKKDYSLQPGDMVPPQERGV